MHYFKVTYWPYFCSLQGTVTTFNHGINHSSNIISHLYKVFNLKDSQVLLQTCIDIQTIYKVPFSPLTAQPRGLKDSIYHFSNMQQLKRRPRDKTEPRMEDVKRV